MSYEGSSPLDARSEIGAWRDLCARDVAVSIRRRRGTAEKIQSLSGDFRRAFLDSGVINDPVFVKRAFAARALDLREARREDVEQDRIDTSLVPLEISVLRVRSPFGPGFVEPIRARALMDSSGLLSVSTVSRSFAVPPIWFVPEAFERDGAFGDLEAYAAFLDAYVRKVGVWPDTWFGAVELFEESARAATRRTSGLFFDSLVEAKRVLRAGWVQVARVASTASPSVALLDSILQSDAHRALDGDELSLLRRFAGGEGEKAAWNREGFSDYVGHASATVALGAGQRAALACESFLREGEVFSAVGGPGTGKSSMLLPVAASAYVRAAMNHLEPPAILAVTESFEDAAEAASLICDALGSVDLVREDGIDRTWFDLRVGASLAAVSRDGFVHGCVLVSDLDLREFDRAPALALESVVASIGAGGQARFADVLLAASLPRFSDFWLERAVVAFGPLTSIAEGQQAIRDRLLDLARRIHGIEAEVARMESRLDVIREYASSAVVGSVDFFEVARANVADRIAIVDATLRDLEAFGPVARQESRALERSIRREEDEETERSRAAALAEVSNAVVAAKERLGISALVSRLDSARALRATVQAIAPTSGVFDSLAFSLSNRAAAVAGAAASSGAELDLHPKKWTSKTVVAFVQDLDSRIVTLSSRLGEDEDLATAIRVDAEVVAFEIISVRRAEVVRAREIRREAEAEREVARRAEISDEIIARGRLRDTLSSVLNLASDMRALRERYGISDDVAPDVVRETLDTGLRHEAYLLAARYWEGEFLRRACSFIRTRPPGRREILRTASCIFPVLLGRINDVCDVLRTPRAAGSSPLLGYADVVFIDDAARIPVYRVAPILALSRRAFVVGDAYDRRVETMAHSDVSSKFDGRSVLDWALNASRFSRYDGTPVLLREQYTLPSELAEIVSRFWFDESPRAAAAARPHPPLPSFVRLSSDDCDSEVVDEYVASWISSIMSSLESAYSGDRYSEFINVSCFERVRADSLRSSLVRLLDPQVARRVVVTVCDRSSRARYPVVLCVAERLSCSLDAELDVRKTDAMALGAIASVIDSFVLLMVGRQDVDRVSALSRLYARSF